MAGIIEAMRRWTCLAVLVCAALSTTAQIDPRTALLERTGWDALAAGRAHTAADAFREAIVADPKNARLHFGAATAAFLEHRDADARDAIDRALAIDPKLAGGRALLGQVLHRMGDAAGAIRAYELLTLDTPDDKDAAATLARWRRELDLHDRMQQSVSAHFTVSFEGPAESTLADQALASLERAYWRVGGVLSTYPADPVRVVLYTAEQFSDITRSPTWAAAAYDGTIRVPVRGALDRPAELDRVLAHEFVHAVVRTLADRNVPTWLNEGLATALEAEDLSWADRSVSAAGKPAPLGQLRNGFGRFTGAQAALAYATSALAVRRLIDDAGGFAVVNLVRDLGQGADFQGAFLHRVQRSYADFEASPVR
jgi:tetratricopeptide (TPR) repeat protein